MGRNGSAVAVGALAGVGCHGPSGRKRRTRQPGRWRVLELLAKRLEADHAYPSRSDGQA